MAQQPSPIVGQTWPNTSQLHGLLPTALLMHAQHSMASSSQRDQQHPASQGRPYSSFSTSRHLLNTIDFLLQTSHGPSAQHAKTYQHANLTNSSSLHPCSLPQRPVTLSTAAPECPSLFSIHPCTTPHHGSSSQQRVTSPPTY